MTLFYFVVGSLIGALFLWASAAVVGIQQRSYTKSLVATVVTGIATALFSGLLHLLSIRAGWISMALLVAMHLFVIKSVFTTSWGKAFGAWFVQVLAFVVLVIVPVFAVFGLAVANAGFSW